MLLALLGVQHQKYDRRLKTFHITGPWCLLNVLFKILPHPPSPPSPPATQLVNAQVTQNMLFGTWRNIFKTKAQLDQWCSNYVVWHSDDVCFSTAPKEFKLKWTDLLGHVGETRAHDLTLTVTGFTRMMSRLSFIYYKEARDIFGINLKQTRDMSSGLVQGNFDRKRLGKRTKQTLQMNIWKIIYLNCRERYEFMIDHRRHTHNSSSGEIIAEVRGSNPVQAWIINS